MVYRGRYLVRPEEKAIDRMRARRDAVEHDWVQSERKAVDEVALDPDLFQPKVSWDFGQPHRTMVAFRNSKFAYLFYLIVVVFCIYFITWLIRMRLHS